MGGWRQERGHSNTHTLQFHSSLSCSRAKFVDSFLHLLFPILFFHELNAPLTPPSLAIFSKCQQWKRIRECSEGERRRRENCYLTLIQFRLTFPSLLSPFDTYPVTEATKKRRRGRTDGRRRRKYKCDSRLKVTISVASTPVCLCRLAAEHDLGSALCGRICAAGLFASRVFFGPLSFVSPLVSLGKIRRWPDGRPSFSAKSDIDLDLLI